MKRLFKKSFRAIKAINENDLGSIPRIFLSCVLVIFFFYFTPIIINFADNKILNKKEFQNNSKAILAYTLNQKNNPDLQSQEKINERDLLIDIFSLNDLETDTVRLDASTIKQLFEDTGYKLDDVRKKLVKPVALTLLPQEIKMIEKHKKKKGTFYPNCSSFNS